ncbi:copper resistance CopC family protein [Pseudofrankia sp. DC12]|uniref:copper resistance CopC family protein n=1 Tax=Pseudofrankia sp. DC12 TaxID=683315 RepID=UPI0006989297|nr:copper resistance CopC family protein [Pseudofrankia sp. DC12]
MRASEYGHRSGRVLGPRAGGWALGRRVGAGLAGVGLALVALVAIAAPASAHTRLLSSTPADGSTVPVAPDQIQLTFAQHLLGLGAVAVEGPGGSNAAVGDAVLDGAIVTQRLADHRPAGVYRLSYRIVSADGHPVTGQVTFTATGDVGSGSSPTAAAASATIPPAAGAPAGGGTTLPGTGATSEGKGGSSAGLVVGIAVGVGVLVVVSGAVIALRARRGQGGTDGA